MPHATPAAAIIVLALRKPPWPVRNLVARRARFRPERPSVPRKTTDKTSAGLFIEVQGTAEAQPFDRAQMDSLLALADSGIRQLVGFQREVVGKILKY